MPEQKQTLYRPSLRDEVEQLHQELLQKLDKVEGVPGNFALLGEGGSLLDAGLAPKDFGLGGGEAGFPVDYRDVEAETAQALADVLALEQEGQDNRLKLCENRLAQMEGGSGAQGGETPVLVVGTALSGHTEDQVDILCTGSNDQEKIAEVLSTLDEEHGSIVRFLEGRYNFSSSIVVLSKNTTFEGLGSVVIDNRANSECAFYIANSNNTIKNLDFLSQYSWSVIQIASDGNEVDDIRCEGGTAGIICQGSGNIIKASTFNGFQSIDAGIVVEGANNFIERCGFFECDKGIQVLSSNHSIYFCQFEVYNIGIKIGLDCKNIALCHNHIVAGNSGIDSESSHNVLIDDNVVEQCEKGIILQHAAESDRSFSIKNNTVQNCESGITVNNVRVGYMAHNICSENNQGISLQGCVDITLYGNVCNANGSGISSYMGERLRFISNQCSHNNNSGIYAHSQDVFILSNCCEHNKEYGICGGNGKRLLIVQNKCHFNMYPGISCAQSSFSSIIQNNCGNNQYKNIELGQYGLAENNVCTGGDNGISGLQSYVVVKGNTCSDHKRNAISLGNYCEVSHNECLHNTGYGISCSGDYNSISSNNCADNYIGIATSGKFVMIQNNRCETTQGESVGINCSSFCAYIGGNRCVNHLNGIVCNGSNCVVSRNECSDCGRQAIGINATDALVTQNYCSKSSIGIRSSYYKNVKIVGNIFTEVDNAILAGGSNLMIAENIAIGGNIAIEISGSDQGDFTIRNNQLTNNEQYGIRAYTHGDVSHNKISGTPFGIYLKSSLTNSVLSNNVCTDCTDRGIYIEAPEASITGNICDSCGIGLNVVKGKTMVSANTLKNNTTGISSGGDNMIVTNQLINNETPLDTKDTDFIELNRIL